MQTQHTITTSSQNNADKTSFLKVAYNIGLDICREAIWYGDQCNWMTMTFDVVEDKMEEIYKTLEPDFYAGTTGVGHFLTSLYAVTDEPIFYKTAKGALNQAIANRDKLDKEHLSSFYRGLPGILYLLFNMDIPDKTAIYEELIKEIKTINIAESKHDPIDGSASAICIFLKMYQQNKDHNLLELAVKFGDDIITRAEKSNNGWSWPTRGNSSQNLLGYSHGAAGIGHALFELYHITNDYRYMEGGYEAIRYENTYFDQKSQNWPDFRGESQPNEPMKFCHAWCHGAPGIGLARVRTFSITQDPKLKKDIDAAVHSTLQHITQSLNYDADFTLCHGIAGNTDLLLEASRLFNDSEMLQKAHNIARAGKNKYDNVYEETWPNGLGNKHDIVDFMLGTAGIGYFYLRLYDPNKFPSMLLITS